MHYVPRNLYAYRKFYVAQNAKDKRILWTAIRSDLSGAGFAVCSKTIRSRLADDEFDTSP
ncbi:UNVERIFIED_CONTAM: hypothetical protein NCL1_19514 [Trichonephila clavipes]